MPLWHTIEFCSDFPIQKVTNKTNGGTTSVNDRSYDLIMTLAIRFVVWFLPNFAGIIDFKADFIELVV